MLKAHQAGVTLSDGIPYETLVEMAGTGKSLPYLKWHRHACKNH